MSLSHSLQEIFAANKDRDKCNCIEIHNNALIILHLNQIQNIRNTKGNTKRNSSMSTHNAVSDVNCKMTLVTLTHDLYETSL